MLRGGVVSVRVVVPLLVVGLAAACGRVSSEAEVRDVADSAATLDPFDAALDSGGFSADTSPPPDTADAALPPDLGPDTFVFDCADPRYPHDRKVIGDYCWSPPEHYCSMGCPDLEDFKACNPDGTVCCRFNCCAPCGWTACSAGPIDSGPCLTVPESNRSVCGKAGWPGPICRDGFDAGGEG